jgi:hypothetical protein
MKKNISSFLANLSAEHPKHNPISASNASWDRDKTGLF